MNARLFRIAWLRVMMKPLIRGLSSIFIRRSGMSATCCRFLAASSSLAQMPECPICLQVIHDAWRNVQKSMQSPAHVSPCCDMSWLCFWGHARSPESVLRTEDPLWAPCNHKFCRCSDRSNLVCCRFWAIHDFRSVPATGHCIIQVLKSRAPEWAGDCPLCRIHISVSTTGNSSRAGPRGARRRGSRR